MKAKIYSHTKLIGTVDLQIGDESMGCVYGDIVPTEVYFKDIQRYAWKDHKKWLSLRLNVQLENGYFLYPVGGYTISDSPEFPDEPKRIDIAGLDWHVLADYFRADPPKPSLEDPWIAITIEQKIAFEDELKKELGIRDKSLLDIFKRKQEKHELAGFDFSALGKLKHDDDVLFSTNADKGKYTVIHLTWKRQQEIKGFPDSDFYTEFDDFKQLRMYPDKAESED